MLDLEYDPFEEVERAKNDRLNLSQLKQSLMPTLLGTVSDLLHYEVLDKLNPIHNESDGADQIASKEEVPPDLVFIALAVRVTKSIVDHLDRLELKVRFEKKNGPRILRDASSQVQTLLPRPDSDDLKNFNTWADHFGFDLSAIPFPEAFSSPSADGGEDGADLPPDQGLNPQDQSREQLLKQSVSDYQSLLEKGDFLDYLVDRLVYNQMKAWVDSLKIKEPEAFFEALESHRSEMQISNSLWIKALRELLPQLSETSRHDSHDNLEGGNAPDSYAAPL
jgi:hypothetical protein